MGVVDNIVVGSIIRFTTLRLRAHIRFPHEKIPYTVLTNNNSIQYLIISFIKDTPNEISLLYKNTKYFSISGYVFYDFIIYKIFWK